MVVYIPIRSTYLVIQKLHVKRCYRGIWPPVAEHVDMFMLSHLETYILGLDIIVVFASDGTTGSNVP